MKKIIRISAIWIITGFYLVLVFGFVLNQYESQLCNNVQINIQDSVNTRFLLPGDVLNLMEIKNIQYLGKPLKEIDRANLENVIQANQIVKECKVYTTVTGTLNVDIDQRDPYVRIIGSGGKGFYLDRDGNALTLSSGFSPHVLVVNGNIKIPFETDRAVNVLKLGDSKEEIRIKEIFELSEFIANNEFWGSQIVQIYIDKSGEYELVPRVGPHIILLGKIENYQEKLRKLKIFYEEGLSRTGWNQYIKINLKYQHQVVCTKI